MSGGTILMADQQAKKIIGLACGRRNGNSEVLLKEALMAAEELELGIATEIIRVLDLRVQPCTGCQACGGPGVESKDHKCIIKDDVEWILEKTLLENAALIISFPCYHLQINGHLKMITDRMNSFYERDIEILRKDRIGALISVGGSAPDWTAMAFATANIFLQHTRKLVDQLQVNYAPLRGDVLAMEDALARARQLGQNVARSLMLPIDEVKYLGTDSDVACPVCHCNLLQVPDRLPRVFCPVCWVEGQLFDDGDGMKVRWNEKDVQFPRFSVESHLEHFKENEKIREKWIKANQDRFDRKSELLKKYAAYGNIVKPG